MESQEGSTDQLVRKRFKVLDHFILEEGAAEYKVEYEERSKEAFAQLSGELAPLRFTPRLHGTKQNATLFLSKTAETQSRSRAPLILLSLTLISIVITGLFLSLIFQQVSPRSPVIPTAVAFTISIVGILGLHEVAHRRVSGSGGKGSSVPYYIPNVPIFPGLPILSFLPTFGSVTFVRRPSLNKDALFNIYFVGPVVGMLVALAVSVAGAATSAILSQAEYARIFSSQSNIVAVNMNESILQSLVKDILVLARLTPAPQTGAVYISSPIDIAAWVGFLVTFLNLLPAAVFDGGVMTRLVLGSRWSRIATALTAIVLLAIDTPNYWVVVLLIFLLAARPVAGETLDSISGISSSKKALYLLALVILILCAPVPQNFATIPLGSTQ